MGMTEVPVRIITGLNEAQKKAYILAHNQLTLNTGYHSEMLAEEMLILKEADIDLSITGFKEADIDSLLKLDLDAPEEDPFDDNIEGSTMLAFKSDLLIPYEDYVDPYQFPMLDPERLGTFPTDGHIVWTGRNRTTDDGESTLVYLFGSDSTVGLDSERTIIMFFVDDIRFERVWNNLPKIAMQFVQAGVKTVVMPDFSMGNDYRMAERIYNNYRSKFIARYFQECGINVIPNISTLAGNNEFAWMGIPKGAEFCACQLQTQGGKLDGEDADMRREGLGVALDQLKPVHLVVYAGEPGLRLGQEICERHGVKFIGVKNRAAHMRSDVANSDKHRPF